MKPADNTLVTPAYAAPSPRADLDASSAKQTRSHQGVAYGFSGPRRSGPGRFFGDYGIAIAIAVGAHVAFAFSGGKTAPAPKVVEEPGTVAMSVNLQIEPEETLLDEDTPPSETNAPAAESFAPPQLVDVPSVAFDSSFVQPLQPTVPQVNTSSMMTVPKGPVSADSVRGRVAQIFSLAQLDQTPEIVGARAKPMYPPELKRNNITGTVLLSFIIDATGAVKEVEVIRSSHPGFDSAAIQAVKRWKFKAGRKGGAAVSTRMEAPIEFNLGSRS